MCAAVTSALPSTSDAAAAAITATTMVAAANKTSASNSSSSTAAAAGAVGGAANSNNGSGSGTYRSSAICRYYLRGICRFGTLCHFSHDAIGGEILSCSSDDGATEASTSAAANVSEKCGPLANWADAPAFVPSGRAARTTEVQQSDDVNGVVGAVALEGNVTAGGVTWADVVGGRELGSTARAGYVQFSEPGSVDTLCPYESPCPYGVYCAYAIHLEQCKMCDQFCLHPTDVEQRRKHNKECLQQHEQAMELSFAIARSRDKTCGICMETIMEKQGREKRFGILPNCTHIFCLECIRKWRQAKQFEHKITRSCPECRVSSDFVCPSAFWVETKEEKNKLLTDYRSALGVKDCKYFNKGSGKCPFGNKCFYKHALANGELVDVGCPRRSRKLLRGTNEIIDDLLDIYLWEFVDHRDFNFHDLLSNASDSSDDDSDYYVYA